MTVRAVTEIAKKFSLKPRASSERASGRTSRSILAAWSSRKYLGSRPNMDYLETPLKNTAALTLGKEKRPDRRQSSRTHKNGQRSTETTVQTSSCQSTPGAVDF